MPKLPRGNGKSTTKERAKKPATAKPAAAAASSSSRSAAKKPKAAATTKKKAPARRSNGAAKKPAPKTDFRHRPVDVHTRHAPAGPSTKLSRDQRVLLGDLFAVVEEHSGE